MQSRAARLIQIALYGALSGLAAALLALLAAWWMYRQLTLPLMADALGWAGFGLIFLAGAIVSSQTSLGMGEAQMRAKLGEAYRPPPLPFAQILTALVGAGLLFLAEFLLGW